MALGVRILPEGGNIIQIDTRYENLALKQKGTVTAVGASSGGAAQASASPPSPLAVATLR